jgi:hypothetical protein
MSDEDGNETNWRYAYDMLETVSAMERGESIGGRLNDPKPITPEKFCELTFGAHRGGLTGKMPKELNKEEVELCRNKRIEGYLKICGETHDFQVTKTRRAGTSGRSSNPERCEARAESGTTLTRRTFLQESRGGV